MYNCRIDDHFNRFSYILLIFGSDLQSAIPVWAYSLLICMHDESTKIIINDDTRDFKISFRRGCIVGFTVSNGNISAGKYKLHIIDYTCIYPVNSTQQLKAQARVATTQLTYTNNKQFSP